MTPESERSEAEVEAAFWPLIKTHRQIYGIREQTSPHAPYYSNQPSPTEPPAKPSFADRFVRRFFGK